MLNLRKVGDKIASLRKEHNLSQEELANKLYITRQAVSKWEQGICAPTIDSIIDLTELFNVSFEEILCIKEVKKDDSKKES